MRIGILIFSHPNDDSHAQADRFEAAGRDLGIDVVRIHEPLLTITKDGPNQKDFDAIICRPNFIEEPSLHQFTIQAFKNAGIRVLNGSLQGPKNKLDQHVRMAKLEIPMPHWAIAHQPDDLIAAAEQIGFPVVLKVAFGTHGTGVFFAPTVETMRPIVDYLAVRDGNPVIVEEFIDTAADQTKFPPPSQGGGRRGSARDLRIFVLANKVLAAMERVAKPGDIRANTSIGGTGHPIELTDEEAELAIKSAQAFDLDIAGVDILRSAHGPLVIEVNANPGFKELERVTGLDIAKIILKHAASH